jgi:FtsH-binding integral membrane protein
MKPSPTENALSAAGSVLFMVWFFQKPLGLPESAATILMLAAIVCMLVFFRLRRRAKAQAADIPPDASAGPRRAKRLWLVIAVMAVSCAASPFIMPYTGTTLPFPQLVIISAVTFVLCVGLAIFIVRRQP